MIEVIIIGLASWRVANMLVNEDGPGDIFERLRVFAGLKPGVISGFFPTLFSCMYCMSVWSTIVVYLLWLVIPIGVIIIAAMTIAIIVNHIIEPV